MLICSVFVLNAQDKNIKLLWDKANNIPIPFATIKGNTNYCLSNEEGYFEIFEDEKFSIQNISYNTLEMSKSEILKKDTIFMKSKVFELNEVVVKKEDIYSKMAKTVIREYAFIPHTEKFFLRVVVKKNNEIYKIIDFSGYIEKQTLFETSEVKMPRDNYKVQIENIRKAGIEDRIVDYALFNFNEFYLYITSVVSPPDLYNLSYEFSDDNKTTKIIAKPKKIEIINSNNQYILNEDFTFGEAELNHNLENSPYEKLGKHKHRTTNVYKKSSFQRNPFNNKMQLYKAIFKATTEVVKERDIKEIFEATYYYYSIPVKNIKIENNISLKKDMFDIKFDYNEEYWKSNEVLSLTNEMQEFINKVNSISKSKEFRIKSNIK